MNDTIRILFGLFGGLAIFIYGMNLMSESLQKAAGEKMKSVLALLTKNPLMGVIAGALTTAVLQSSSATTVMAIGFVSAGLMSLPQAISIIFGANIGTTITAQIIAFKISDYIYLFIFLGFILVMMAKSERAKSIGQTLFAFGLLFLGIETMGATMKPLASSPLFIELLGKVAGFPVLGLLVGTVMTVVVQSSSATIAVLQNFSSQAGPDGVSSILGLAGAIPILLGDNIGTTITALLAGIGQSRDAKRTAVAHCIFNLSGALLFIWFVKPYAAVIQYISPKGAEVDVISRQIANAHTGFNLIMTILWTALIGLMVRLVMWLLPEGKKQLVDPAEPQFLDDKLIQQPIVALQLVAQEVMRCGDVVKEMFDNVIRAAREDRIEAFDEVVKQSQIVQSLNDKVMEYLANIFSAGVLTEEQATQTAGIMYLMTDIERIGAMCRQITESVRGDAEKKYIFSKDAMKDLTKSLELIRDMYANALQVVSTGDRELIQKINKKRGKILDLDIHMRKDHMDRIKKGKCNAGLTAAYNLVLHDIDRMSNSCVNIADAAQEKLALGYFLNIVNSF